MEGGQSGKRTLDGVEGMIEVMDCEWGDLRLNLMLD